MTTIENIKSVRYEDNLAKLLSLNFSNFPNLEAAATFYNSLSFEDKELLKNFDINNSIYDKVKYLLYTDSAFNILKRYLECLNYTALAKELNTSKQNVNSMVSTRFKKLQLIVDEHDSSIDIKSFLLEHYKQLNKTKTKKISQVSLILELIVSKETISRNDLKKEVLKYSNISDQRFNSIIKKLRKDKLIFQLSKENYCSNKYLNNIINEEDINKIVNSVIKYLKEGSISTINASELENIDLPVPNTILLNKYLLRDLLNTSSKFKIENFKITYL